MREWLYNLENRLENIAFKDSYLESAWWFWPSLLAALVVTFVVGPLNQLVDRFAAKKHEQAETSPPSGGPARSCLDDAE